MKAGARSGFQKLFDRMLRPNYNLFDKEDAKTNRGVRDFVSTAVVIPARLRSERLPRKTLLKDTGKYLIQHTYETAKKAKGIDLVLVATDSKEIVEAVESFGGKALLTSPEHPSGTDRIAEAARHLRQDIIVNVQGDEPEIEPVQIELVVRLLKENPEASISTLATPITSEEELNDANKVKVVRDERGFALYFSRSAIPFIRNKGSTPFAEMPYLRHLGIYGYRKEVLMKFSTLAESPLERVEKLEQLRALSHGYRIIVGVVEKASPGIDTEEEYREFVERYRSKRSSI